MQLSLTARTAFFVEILLCSSVWKGFFSQKQNTFFEANEVSRSGGGAAETERDAYR